MDYNDDFSGGLKLCAVFDYIRVIEIISSGQLDNENGKWRDFLMEDSDSKIERIRELMIASDQRMEYGKRVNLLHKNYDYFSDNIDCRVF
jgi:hypothetical protein